MSAKLGAVLTRCGGFSIIAGFIVIEEACVQSGRGQVSQGAAASHSRALQDGRADRNGAAAAAGDGRGGFAGVFRAGQAAEEAAAGAGAGNREFAEAN